MTNPSPQDIEQLDFEDALARMETLVDRLERSDVRLKDALAVYKLIHALGDRCQQLLEEAELQVSVLDARGTSVREQAALYQVDLLSGDRHSLTIASRPTPTDEDEDEDEGLGF